MQKKNKAVFRTKSSYIPTQSVCAHLKYFAHRIHSSTLWSSVKRQVHNTQSAPCSSSSVESLAKETVRLVSDLIECQTELDLSKLFCSIFLEDQEEHSTQTDWVWI